MPTTPDLTLEVRREELSTVGVARGAPRRWWAVTASAASPMVRRKGGPALSPAKSVKTITRIIAPGEVPQTQGQIAECQRLRRLTELIEVSRAVSVLAETPPRR